MEARKKYLYQTALRVTHLCDALAEHGLTSGSVLEIGSLYGSFALSLRRLGYDVTAVDRYDEMDPSVNGYVDELALAGVRVVRTTRASETQAIESLGWYDCVIAMAVIEHVPHTPRHLLELMRRRARPGGLLAVDTPNVARYWNRRRLEEGKSIFQDIAAQSYSTCPSRAITGSTPSTKFAGCSSSSDAAMCGCACSTTTCFSSPGSTGRTSTA